MNIEWRHAVGNDPAWMMIDGQMIGEWYPRDGGKVLFGKTYLASTNDEVDAMTILITAWKAANK